MLWGSTEAAKGPAGPGRVFPPLCTEVLSPPVRGGQSPWVAPPTGRLWLATMDCYLAKQGSSKLLGMQFPSPTLEETLTNYGSGPSTPWWACFVFSVPGIMNTLGLGKNACTHTIQWTGQEVCQEKHKRTHPETWLPQTCFGERRARLATIHPLLTTAKTLSLQGLPSRPPTCLRVLLWWNFRQVLISEPGIWPWDGVKHFHLCR